MTQREVELVVEVLATVDGGCSTCATDAAGEMEIRFPSVQWGKLVVRQLNRNAEAFLNSPE